MAETASPVNDRRIVGRYFYPKSVNGYRETDYLKCAWPALKGRVAGPLLTRRAPLSLKMKLSVAIAALATLITPVLSVSEWGQCDG